VVLLHHGLGSVRAWKGQIPALAAAGYRVIVYDRWGFGASSPRSGLPAPHFFEDLADLSALLEMLDAHRPALVGHSDGGTIALRYAAQAPGQVACLVAVAAHVYVEPKMKTGIEGVRRLYENDERFREGLRRAHIQKAGSVFETWFSGWVRPENLDWDLRPALGLIDCPALIVQGMEDEHATPQHAADIAAAMTNAIPQAELWLEPGAGHMLPQEWAEVFNQRLIQFLGKWAKDGGRMTKVDP
jgi:pimeloyl-ACP methyl ester carboxylesterase